MNTHSDARNRCTGARSDGVTLVECLVCLGLAVVVLTMGLEALRLCRAVGTRSAVMSALSLAAQDTLARAATEPFDSLASGTLTTETVLGGEKGKIPVGIPATVERRVTPLGKDLKEVTVHAAWRGGKDPFVVTLATRVTRREEGNP